MDDKKFPNFSEKLGLGTDNPLDAMININKNDSELKEGLDELVKKLKLEGYKVERVPYLGKSSLDDAPWITYNNSVIDGDNIFIPNFDIPVLDDYSNEVYKKYGYNPVTIDMTRISSLSGAINCITKVVEREYIEIS